MQVKGGILDLLRGTPFCFKFLFPETPQDSTILESILSDIAAPSFFEEGMREKFRDVYYDTEDQWFFRSGLAIRKRQSPSRIEWDYLCIPKKWERGQFLWKREPMDMNLKATGGDLEEIQLMVEDKFQCHLDPLTAIVHCSVERTNWQLSRKLQSVTLNFDKVTEACDEVRGQNIAPFTELKVLTTIPADYFSILPDHSTLSHSLKRFLKNLTRKYNLLKSPVSKLEYLLTLAKWNHRNRPQNADIPQETIGAVLLQKLFVNIGEAFNNEPGIRMGIDPEFYHAFRVGLRRAIAILGFSG